jgi:hypothetical protein
MRDLRETRARLVLAKTFLKYAAGEVPEEPSAAELDVPEMQQTQCLQELKEEQEKLNHCMEELEKVGVTGSLVPADLPTGKLLPHHGEGDHDHPMAKPALPTGSILPHHGEGDHPTDPTTKPVTGSTWHGRSDEELRTDIETMLCMRDLRETRLMLLSAQHDLAIANGKVPVEPMAEDMEVPDLDKVQCDEELKGVQEQFLRCMHELEQVEAAGSVSSFPAEWIPTGSILPHHGEGDHPTTKPVTGATWRAHWGRAINPITGKTNAETLREIEAAKTPTGSITSTSGEGDQCVQELRVTRKHLRWAQYELKIIVGQVPEEPSAEEMEVGEISKAQCEQELEEEQGQLARCMHELDLFADRVNGGT